MQLDNIRYILEEKKKRHGELITLLNSQELYTEKSSEEVVAIAQEQSNLSPLIKLYDELLLTEKDIEETKEILEDPELEYDAKVELSLLEEDREELIKELLAALDSQEDSANRVFLEINAGVGGEEAALFVRDLTKIYTKYAEKQGWKVEIINISYSGLEGYKEITLSISGEGVEKFLSSEAGVHRVQRVPETESKGRIQTSAASIAIMPEVKNVELEVKLDECKIEAFRASGPGGQHRNKTESAIRITHLPTGITSVACEKSQHQNREEAMRVLKARIYQKHKDEEAAKRNASKQSQLGKGDRSEKIRTYNWPQNRVTDHRLGENFSLNDILEGKLDKLVSALVKYQRELRIQNEQ